MSNARKHLLFLAPETDAGAGEPGMGVTLRGFSEGQRVFDRYRLERILGRGGMGVVWLAIDEELERRVALKFLPELVCLDKEAIADLKRETRRSLDITHPNIVRIYDFNQDEQTAAISMEYIDGPTLAGRKVERGGCLAVAELRPLLGQLCEALDYAHLRAKVVHRDLKPANVMLTADGEVKIADFGIACSISDSVSRVSMARGTSGTAVFMSPQQAMGERSVPTDDIYALGATIYDLLAGKPPFYRGDVLAQLREGEPVPMAVRREELGLKGEPIPESWEKMVLACLSKNPASRPPTAGKALAMLGEGEPAASPPQEADAVTILSVPSRPAPRQKKKAVVPYRFPRRIGVTVLILAIAMGGWWALQSKSRVTQAERAAAEANRETQRVTPSSPETTVHAAPPETVATQAGKATSEQPVVHPPASPAEKSAKMPTQKSPPPTKAPSLEERASGGDADAQYELAIAFRDGTGHPKDAAKAAGWFRMAADQGHGGAQSELGELYRKGEGVGRDEKEALKWLRKSAEQGNSKGQANLGYLYSRGIGVAEDPGEAAKWYRLSAEQGDEDGLNRLGYAYESGRGVDLDLKRAAELYGLAMAKGSLKAQVNLGNMHREGLGMPKDEAKALELYRGAAEREHPGAWNALGIAYRKGYGVEPDMGEAVKWFRKAAEAGDPAGQCNLGHMYEMGKGVPKDVAVAADWYRLASDQGSSLAKTLLGWLYQHGEGVVQDIGRAVALYREAADDGAPIAMRRLGLLLEQGIGVAKDEAAAARWYRKAAETGDLDAQYALGNLLVQTGKSQGQLAEAVACFRKAAEAGHTGGQYRLGWCYASGRGVEKDDRQALLWYTRAAQGGEPAAACNIGVMYANGWGVQKSAKTAVTWYRKGAEAGDPMSQNNLGWMCETGSGVEKNIDEALRWYEKAAAAANSLALTNLGRLYSEGRVVPKDLQKAADYYARAAALGDASAKERLKQLPAPTSQPIQAGPPTQAAPSSEVIHPDVTGRHRIRAFLTKTGAFRQRPQITAPVVFQIPANEVFDVCVLPGAWWFANVSDGSGGYIRANDLRVVAPPGATVSYVARLGPPDMVNSQRQNLTELRDVLRQDRANYHSSTAVDAGDTDDGCFQDKVARECFESRKIVIGGREQDAFGGLVHVDVWPTKIEVRLLPE